MNLHSIQRTPEPIHADFGERTVNELLLMFRHHQINLEPGFQRKSVWSTTDRRRLIQSITSSYPLPSIFLYRRTLRGGKLIYDVIDGKQRLESILMFMREGRFKRRWFDVRLDLEDEGIDWYDYRAIKRHFPLVRNAIDSYKIQTVEVTGELSEIIDLFVRINSTGKPLTSGEKRHARFYNSPFLKEAEWLVHRSQRHFLDNDILTQTQLDRMKGTELVAELLMSIHQGGIINKKTALDRAIGNDSVNGNTLSRISREFTATFNTLRRMFPDIRETRFHNAVDFYTLFMLVWEMRKQEFVLHDRSRNKVAFRLMKRLSAGVDELREHLKRAKMPKQTPHIFSEYLLTVQGDTDSAANRERRRTILRNVLWTLFDYKDDRRLFTAEQRRLIWDRDENKCAICGRKLRWDDFHADHIVAWTKGGRTSTRNAQLLCRTCNSRKGAR